MPPWDKRLEQFEDPEIRAAVDAMMREDVQPYITQLEERANTSQDAADLLRDLEENPGQTYVALTREMFGDEAADRVVAAIESGADPEEAAAEAMQDASEEAGLKLSPQQQKALDWAEETYRRDEYDRALSALEERHKDDPDFVKIDKDLFSPFLMVADSDVEAAYAGYKQYNERFMREHGISVDEASLENLDPGAPPTLGSSTSSTPGSGDTAVQKEYHDFGEAIDDLWNDLKGSPPPTLGQV